MHGLTSDEVNLRKKQGLVNYDVLVKTKSLKEIIISNSLTIFNVLNLSLGLLIFMVKSYKNLFFLGIIILNTIIGILEEIKAKKELTRLKILVNNKARVIRNEKEEYLNSNEIVIDDLIKYLSGDQILVDSKILSGELLVDESFITGESEPIFKKSGDVLLSGSFVITGESYGKVINIGKDNYSSKIINQITLENNNNSIVINALNKFIKFISIIIIPIGLILLWQQYNINHDIKNTIISTVAALVAMIPDGLVLLSSTVFLVAALKLTQKNILVQDLNCIDSLANIDTFCFDKTGTITNDNMEVYKVISLDNSFDMDEVISAFSYNSIEENATIRALKKYANAKNDYEVIKQENFNSKTKYSSITFKDKGTFYLGAKEVIDDTQDIKDYEENYRVLLMAHSNKDIKSKKVIAIILINDTIKENAKDVIKSLIKKDIDIKLISGDSLVFLKAIAKRLEFKNIRAIDLSKTNDIDYDLIVREYNIFSRVTPEQKKNIIKSLRKNHKVAYMGDGVNDTLALKEADASISFINAKESAKAASKIILLNNDFNSINVLIDMGRKCVNNLTRSATLFINKTIYSTLLALLFLFVDIMYPFQPIQLTLNNFVLIGVPSFILSLLPNNEKIKKHFIQEVLKKSIPTSIIIFLNIILVIIMNNCFNIENYYSTLCFYLVTFNGFLLLYKICTPLNLFTSLLILILLFIYFFGIIFMRTFFCLSMLPNNIYIFLLIVFFIDICLFNIINFWLNKGLIKYGKNNNAY